MKFVRIAVLYFNNLPDEWMSFEATVDGVAVETIPIGQAPAVAPKTRVMLKAEVTLTALPFRDLDGFLAVPTEARRACEAAIEHLANTIAVTGRSRRSISSATPCAAFVAESDEEAAFLADSAGVKARLQSRMGARYKLQPNNDFLRGLSDRREGVALLAEVLSHEMSIGKYRDIVRLFELAFALPVNGMEKKLSQFLAGANLGYTRREVAEWLAMRHPASHGDKAKTKMIALNADYVPLIARMEQAAMDVLFNKEDWHSNSRTRRTLLDPLAATTSQDGDLKVIQGSAVTFECQLLDEFGVYPMDLNGIIVSPPQEWWWKPQQHEPETAEDDHPAD